MRNQFLMPLLIGVLIGVLGTLGAQAWPPISSPHQKGSYALGAQMGRTFARSKIEVSPVYFASGLRDGMGDKSRLNPDQAREGIEWLQADARKKLPSPASVEAPAPEGPGAADSEGPGAPDSTDSGPVERKAPGDPHRGSSLRKPKGG